MDAMSCWNNVDILKVVFAELEPSSIESCSLVSLLWHKAAAEFCTEQHKSTIGRWLNKITLEQYPPRLIAALGGEDKIFALKKMENVEFDHPFSIVPEQMSNEFMRGLWKGLPFVAYKYQGERGDLGVEVFIKRTDLDPEKYPREWTSKSYVDMQGSSGCFLPDDYYSEFENFITSHESNLTLINNLSLRIHRIVPEADEQATAGSTGSKRRNTCVVS